MKQQTEQPTAGLTLGQAFRELWAAFRWWWCKKEYLGRQVYYLGKKRVIEV